MCSMDKCFMQTVTGTPAIDNGFSTGNLDKARMEKTAEVRSICEMLGRQYKRIHKKDTMGFNYYECRCTGKYVCFMSRNLLMQVSEDKFRMYANKYMDHKQLKVKFVNYNNNTIMIVNERNPTFRPQVGFVQKCIDTLKTPFIMLEGARDLVNRITSKASKMLLIDIISLLLHLRDGYFTATKVVGVIMQLYTIHTRYMDLFSPSSFRQQSGPTVTELLLGFSLMGLPGDVLNAIKTFSTLTGKRIFESDTFLELADKMFDCLITIVKWISQPFEGMRLLSTEMENTILDILNKLGNSVFMHKDIKKVCDIYTKYVANPQILFDPTFRQEIMRKYDELKANAAFMSYVQNANNKYFVTTWNLFEANVVKSCQAFDTSGRDEPICFVFEGEAGSGKSCIMNMFVALLKESGMTTICHSVPAAEDGKDFYDDYENQDVFVMDDVGQQGKSQWRYLINYVSPVKYPLPCATASKKNTKFFNSKVVLCTTNHFRDLDGFTSTDCISEPEALFRRAHVISIYRGVSDHFSQSLQYWKYDHIGSKAWENRFINHNAVDVPEGLKCNFSTEDEYRADNSKRVLCWLYSVFKHIMSSEKKNNQQMAMSEKDLRDILNYVNRPVDEFEDAEDDPNAPWKPEAGWNDFNYTKYVLRAMMPNSYLTRRYNARNVSVVNSEYYRKNPKPIGYYDQDLVDENRYVYYYDIAKEFINYYVGVLAEYAKSVIPYITNFVMDTLRVINSTVQPVAQTVLSSDVMGYVLIILLVGYIVNHFFGDEEVQSMPTPEFSAETIKDFNKINKHLYFGPQSAELRNQHEEWARTIRTFCKTLIVKHDNDALQDEHTQCVVSGKRILLPAHLDVGNKFVDIYNSWNHYRERHVEIENVQLKLIRRYVLHDLAVYEIKNTVPIYKLNKQIFMDGGTNARNWYLINSCGVRPVVYDEDVTRNDEPVRYSNVYGKYEHGVDSGFYTPYTATGACGTVLAAPGVGIIGFHVAGNATMGFCVQPPVDIMKEIRELMLQTPSAQNFSIDERVIENFSGVRLRYENKVEQIRTLGSTSFEPSPLHVSVCPQMQQLIHDVENESATYTPTPISKVDVKLPPNFASKGTPAKTLKYLSKKSFMHQGRITAQEMEFMKDYLRTIMVPFTDLDDQEVAFGGTYVPALNKDSSNGYGCLKKKEHYFDFENKIIKPDAYALIDRVSQNAKSGIYDYNDFMCRETFKDELRKSSKVDEPRTFRVMPLGHIWWTKKIFGQLLKHFKETRMDTGISVGYNPYIDSDVLAKKLISCVKTGDADFGKWDGTILAALIHLIMDVFGEFYKGDNAHMIEWLSNTIANSFVLVNDEIYATTHGLPSGTWLTLLLNCLLNKCLTALVIYRYKPNPCVEDVHSVVDFVTGDDKVFGACERLAPYFNLVNIKKVAESLGMDCTNGDKTKIERDSQEFSKLTYVKRHFRKHPVLQRYVGCLSLDTIINTLQWIDTTTEDRHTAMMGKMRSMQVESYLHSPGLFSALTKIFNERYPFEAFFDEKKIVKILTDEKGYDHVLDLLGKNFNH
nr:MAG: nonstructural polyprotein [Hangzhou picorna-like virus 1]